MGQPGSSLHGGRTAHGSQFFDFHNGRFYNGLLVVAFELEETVTNGGGLCCVTVPPNEFSGTHGSDNQAARFVSHDLRVLLSFAGSC